MSELSIRLSTIASLVPEDARVCDVGTDHAFLPIFLKRRGRVKSVIATDINPKPLAKAEENIKRSKVEGISLRLCDGISGVKPDEADTFIIAGMGGQVISGILKRGEKAVKSEKITLILQPTTSPEFLRKFLYQNGFSILKEIPVEENGKLYSVMLCAYTRRAEEREEGFYFSGLVDPSDEIGRKYIEKQKNRAFMCLKALENIEEKKNDYLYFKNVFENLKKLV